MSAQAFTLFFTDEAQCVLDELGKPVHAAKPGGCGGSMAPELTL